MLDVIGALIDPADARVAIEALYAKVREITVAPEGLDRFRTDPFGGFRRDELRHAGFHQGRQAGNRQRSCMQHHLPRGLDAGSHRRNTKTDRLMIDDLLSEHHALTRIG